MENKITIAMNAHYKNYTEQFKKWFLRYNDNFNIRINLFTNLPEEFKNFKYSNLFVYSVEDLIPEESIEKKLLMKENIPYRSFPWSARRHIIKKSFDLGYNKVLYLENDVHFGLTQEKLEQIINLTEPNTICTTQSIWCDSSDGNFFRDQGSVMWFKEFNKKHNLNVQTEGFCSYDAPDILYNFTEDTYKSYFNWWDKMVDFNNTYSPSHNTGKMWVFLNAQHKIQSKRYPIEGITTQSHFLHTKHDPSVHYESPLIGNDDFKKFFE